MTISIDTLKNGIRVITEEISSIESVSVGIWINAGSRNERKEENGIAHFLEHMAFKGTKKRNALQIAEEIENVGGFINAYTSREITCYYAKVLKNHLPLAVEILSDIICNSIFNKKEIEVEKGVIIQEIGMMKDTPDDVIFELLQKEAFADTSLGRSILGSTENIQSFKRQNFVDFIDNNYFAEKIVLCGAGNLKHKDLCKLAENLKNIKASKKQTKISKIAFKGGENRVIKDLEQAHFAVGFKAPNLKSPKLFAGKLFSVIMGGGMSSRLFQEIREKRGLCYSIGTSFDCYSDNGIFLSYAGTSGEKVKELSEVIALEFKKSITSITESEVERAKTQLRSSLLMGLENSSSRSERLARGLIIWDKLVEVQETIAKIESVKLMDVKNFGLEMFHNSYPAMALYGKVKDALDVDQFSQKLLN
ncbi:MAG: M16 family metallopeptidase [Paracoccaceae bacterium]